MANSPLFLNYEPTLLDASVMFQNEARSGERDLRYGNALKMQQQQRMASAQSVGQVDDKWKWNGLPSWWAEKEATYKEGMGSLRELLYNGADPSDPAYIESLKKVGARSMAENQMFEQRFDVYNKFQDRVNAKGEFGKDVYAGAGGYRLQKNEKGEPIGLATNADATTLAYGDKESYKWDWNSGEPSSREVLDNISKAAAHTGSEGGSVPEDLFMAEDVGKVVNLVQSSDSNEGNLAAVLNESMHDMYGRYPNQMVSLYMNSPEGKQAIRRPVEEGGILTADGEVDQQALMANITQGAENKPSWLTRRVGMAIAPHLKTEGDAFRQLIGMGSGSSAMAGPINEAMELNAFQGIMADPNARTRSGKTGSEASFDMFTPAVVASGEQAGQVVAASVNAPKEQMGTSGSKAYGKSLGTIANVGGRDVQLPSEPIAGGRYKIYGPGGTLMEGNATNGLVFLGQPSQYQVVPEFSPGDPKRSVVHDPRTNAATANRRALAVGGSQLGIAGTRDQARGIEVYVPDVDRVDEELAKTVNGGTSGRTIHRNEFGIGDSLYPLVSTQKLKAAVDSGKVPVRRIPLKKVTYEDLMDDEELAAAFKVWNPEADFKVIADQNEAAGEFGVTQEQVNHLFGQESSMFSDSQELFIMRGVSVRLNDDMLADAIANDPTGFKGAKMSSAIWDYDPTQNRYVEAAQKVDADRSALMRNLLSQ